MKAWFTAAVALIAAFIGGAADAQALFAQHADRSIWQYMGTPCVGEVCSGWRQIDRHPGTREITASWDTFDQVYRIYRRVIPVREAMNPTYADDGGAGVYRFDGTPCSASDCPGWVRVDAYRNIRQIQAWGGLIGQIHDDDGSIYIGQEPYCVMTPMLRCRNWEWRDTNSRTTHLAANSNTVFQRHSNGALWRWNGHSCRVDPGCWDLIDNNPSTLSITGAGVYLFQLHLGGRIWRWDGAFCVRLSCRSWSMIDNNPHTRQLAAGPNQLFQLHDTGAIWRWTEHLPCIDNSCPNWEMIDNNPRARQIVTDGDTLYQLHDNGSVWVWTGQACAGGSCVGWTRIGADPATRTLFGAVR